MLYYLQPTVEVLAADIFARIRNFINALDIKAQVSKVRVYEDLRAYAEVDWDGCLEVCKPSPTTVGDVVPLTDTLTNASKDDS